MYMNSMRGKSVKYKKCKQRQRTKILMGAHSNLKYILSKKDIKKETLNSSLKTSKTS